MIILRYRLAVRVENERQRSNCRLPKRDFHGRFPKSHRRSAPRNTRVTRACVFELIASRRHRQTFTVTNGGVYRTF